MKKQALIFAGALLLAWWGLWQFAALQREIPQVVEGAALPADALRNLPIAPRAEALSFARYGAESPRLLLVSSYENGVLRGIDLQEAIPGSSDDPVTLFQKQGYEALLELRAAEIAVPDKDLLLSFKGTESQIAVGVNYPEHGEEVEVGDTFLFPKQVAATPHNAGVPAKDYLLDYEIELGFVLLEPMALGPPPRYMGLVLASDYTDRAELMRHVNLFDVSSGDGFTQGKSRAGSMPIGNLFVIPRDYQAFYQSLVLELWHNGQRRQAADPRQMKWDIRRILSNTFQWSTRSWQWDGKPVALPVVDGVIPERTLILSGTPEGVIYSPPTPRQVFVGISEWFFGLHWTRPQRIVEPAIREAHASGRYLRPGDEIVMRAERLGWIHNRILAK